MESQRFVGLELSGGKNERSAIAIFDYFPKNKRLFVVDIDQGFTGIDDKSSDEILILTLREIQQSTQNFLGMAIHGPTSLPPYMKEPGRRLPMPNAAHDPEVLWMEKTWSSLKPRPRPFLPYIQRPCEIYLRHLSQEKFPIPDALGSNWAPIAARMQFLKPYLKGDIIEAYPRAVVSRLVTNFGMSKRISRGYTDLESGVELREQFLGLLLKQLPQVFIYNKDLDRLILEISCFNAFLCGLTYHLFKAGQCDKAPKSFPPQSTWIEVPKKKVAWNEVFAES